MARKENTFSRHDKQAGMKVHGVFREERAWWGWVQGGEKTEKKAGHIGWPIHGLHGVGSYRGL